MGWLSTALEGLTPEEFFEMRGYLGSNGNVRHFVELGRAKVGNTFYSACEYADEETGAIARGIRVIIFTIEKGEICWKVMSDASYPNAVDCPKKLLNMLPVGDPDSWSEKWRAHCLEKHAAKAEEAKRQRAVKNGDTIVFTCPINFHGSTYFEATVVDWKDKSFLMGGYNVGIKTKVLKHYGWELKKVAEPVVAEAEAPQNLDLFGGAGCFDFTAGLEQSW